MILGVKGNNVAHYCLERCVSLIWSLKYIILINQACFSFSLVAVATHQMSATTPSLEIKIYKVLLRVAQTMAIESTTFSIAALKIALNVKTVKLPWDLCQERTFPIQTTRVWQPRLL